ncbi:TetR family transcriptional regulator [Amycolatopsis magusensis]|uniref:TetR family transcriptional regulator n=1 Tax=Amycolatopsis magusensis TaxID=882444 RepID=UPI0024A975C5|nr:TetR family transcriptional regulator [Amycolatopsis magusensis]MDI5976331.1 TetR family transcriptional regulator [Amycolatopsis magusensis]
MNTKQRLVEGVLAVIRDQGITAVSARSVAAAAGANQALIFYHFGTVEELIAQACVQTTETRVATYRDRFASVTSLSGLLDLGREIHETERADGNLAVLAQALAGAQSGGRLAEATREALGKWTAEVESTLVRVLAGSPLTEFADPAGLARATSAGFLGLTLFETVDREGGEQALGALAQLAALADVLENLGPMATKAVRAKLRSAAKNRAT